MAAVYLVEQILLLLPEVTSRKLVSLGIKEEHTILHFIAWATCLVGLIVFICLFFCHACYGRYISGTGKRYPILWYGVNAKLAWCLQESPAFFISLFVILTEVSSKDGVEGVKIFLASLYSIHYLQRALIYPFLIKGGKTTPFPLFLLATLYCTVQGYAQPKGILVLGSYNTSLGCISQMCFGVIIFFIGMGINLHSDHILRSLRKPGESGYKIPTGGMFEYVSGANLFGEIVEWIGFAIASCTITAFSFALFTVFNIGPRAWQHHRWYVEKFEDYPKERKAVIPFVL